MKVVRFTVIVVLVAAGAQAQLSDEYVAYFDGPEGFLLTKAEKKALKNVATDSEAESFIELFWARRDPDLSTSVNEFRIDFEQRVEAADALYGFGSTRGALSDRGLVLILLGKCARRDNRPPGAVVSGVTLPGAGAGVGTAAPTGGAYQSEGSSEFWEYEAEQIPVRIGTDFLLVVFRETRVDANDYELDRTDGSLMRVLAKMPDEYVKNPNLHEVPNVGLVAGSRPASTPEIEFFEDARASWPHEYGYDVRAGLVPGRRHFIWLHLSLSDDHGADRIIGRVRRVDSGESLGTFVVSSADVKIGGGVFELSVPIESGKWTLDVALASERGPLAVTSAEVEAADIPPDGTVITTFIWGTEVRQEPDSEFGDPFNVGGWRVIPVLDPRFSTTDSDSINYMTYVLDPVLGDDGEPHFEASISLFKDGARVARTPWNPAILSKITDGVWMFGSGLSLGRFKQAGVYALKVELKQTADGATGMVEIPFEIVERDAPRN